MMDGSEERHIRFRVGSVFETAWQMRGMERFLMDLALEPQIPRYILDRIAEIHLENARRVMEAAGDRLDMLYFYDDVASQSSLLVSLDMWKEFIQPLHARLVDLAHAKGIPIMYHCDGALYPLIPELLDMGIDVLNPVQLDAIGAPPERLKAEFGDRLAFHGGLDIMELLPKGSPEQIRSEVRRLIEILGVDGGYILCSSHHIQPNTPVENVLAAYEPKLRQVSRGRP
jgi:uroporphyrinogen decarboxylase